MIDRFRLSSMLPRKLEELGLVPGDVHYLRHSSLALNETAYLLGYEDNHSLFRAFQQWEGTSPGEWRARHGAPAPAVSGGVRG